ncbi:MAG: hypothetical protein ACI89J_002917 [Hyphomicrobiaceae bacterium]|jgi:hypothetical protein
MAAAATALQQRDDRNAGNGTMSHPACNACCKVAPTIQSTPPVYRCFLPHNHTADGYQLQLIDPVPY